MSYSVKETKDNLSNIIRLAETGQPQIIRRRETEVAVIVSIDQWKRLNGEKSSLFEILRHSPLKNLELDVERLDDHPRAVNFGE